MPDEALNPIEGDPKYITFKYEDWLRWVQSDQTTALLHVEDAVVIRRQDQFAPQALAVYASSIALTASVLEHQGELATFKRLRSIADYFHEQSVLATEEAWKLPD